MGNKRPSKFAQALAMVKRQDGLVRARDFRKAGIPTAYLTRLCREGILERIGRGVYRLANSDVGQYHDFAVAAEQVPNGVICLLSALVFHELTDENPLEVWMAIDVKARRPRLSYPPVRFCRFSGAALTEGVATHRLEGAEVRIYAPEKTLADCLKYRNKIGLEVFLTALKRYLRRPARPRLDDLLRYASLCRVEKLMRRYLEGAL